MPRCAKACLILFCCMAALLRMRVSAQTNPSTSALAIFTLHPQGGVFSSGTSQNLTCTATSPTATPVSYSWQWDDSIVPGETKSWFVTHVQANGMGVGEFICLATNDMGTIGSRVAVVQIAVLETSFMFSDAVSASTNAIFVREGQPAILSCGDYTSIPNSQLNWDLFDNPPIRLDPSIDFAIEGLNDSLYLQNSSRVNQVTYQCSVDNSITKETRTGYVAVTVESTSLTPSVPIILSAPKDMVVREGDDAFFECIIGGSPLPAIMWTFPASRTATVRPCQTRACIRVQNVKANDAGVYMCTAAGVGSFTATLSLAVLPSLTTTLPSSLLTVTYGSTISLDCDSAQDGDWYWYHNGFRLSGEVASRLEVSSSVEADSGTYQCFFSNTAGSVSSAGLVSVITVPASITNGGLPATHLVFRNQSFELMCMADGAPPPTYVWLKESVPLSHGRNFDLSTNGVLRIENVEVSSGGSYTCRASNQVEGREIGRDETSTVLTVITPTTITNELGELFQVQVGTTTTLLCEVTSHPDTTLSFSWTKNGQVLSSSDRITFIPSSEGSENVRVERVKKSDAGIYVCTVSTAYTGLNGPAVSSTSTNLTVTDMPIAPVIIAVTAVSSTTLNIQWHFPGSSDVLSEYSIEIQEQAKSDLGWMRVKTQSSIVTTVTNIEELVPFTEYNVRVLAVYSQGTPVSTVSRVKSATTLSEIPSDPPQNIQILAPNNTALRFSWQSPTQPNGIISDYRIQYRILRDRNNVDFTTVRVGSGTALTFLLTGLLTLERYEYQLAAVNSAGVGPYSETMHADTIAPTITEPKDAPFHQQIWFITLMVIVVIVVITVVAALILVIKHSARPKTQRYNVRHSEPFGGDTVSDTVRNPQLSADAFKDYNTRNTRAGAELTMYDVSNGMDMDTDQDVNFIDTNSLAYSSTVTPQLSMSSSTRLVPHSSAPGYINPPPFEEAIKRSRSRTHSMSSTRSGIEKPPSDYWEVDQENKSVLIDEPVSDLEDDINKGEVMSSPHHYNNQHVLHARGLTRHSNPYGGQYEYDDSDSIGKPSYDSSDITEGTEYSHLQTIGETRYSHLETPDTNADLTTFV